MYSISGANLQTMINMVMGFTVKGPLDIDVSQFSRLVFHVGTNNVGQPTADIQNLFLELLQAVRQRCHNPKVFFSCILPRPKDSWNTGGQVRALNRWLRRWARAEGIHTIDAAPLFLHRSGKINLELYRKDKLHLKSAGLAKLTDKFRQVIVRFCTRLPGLAVCGRPQSAEAQTWVARVVSY